MKKLIGIYVGALYFPRELMHQWDERNKESGGIGGSEIWAIEIAEQFVKKGFNVMIFADCGERHITETGVEFVPMRLFSDVCKEVVFDYFIASRRSDIISDEIKCDNVYIMAHDPFLLWTDTYEQLKMDRVKKIAVQSTFQKNFLKKKYVGLTDDDFFFTHQAIDFSRYDYDVPKKNKMVWSTHKIRGARFLIERVLPLIRKAIPDFEIDVCGYANDVTDEYFKAEGVNIIGNVSKDELIRRQMESRIWIYPNYGRFDDGRINDETFCITAIENAAANNAIILADKTCFSSTLEGYDGFIGTECFKDGEDILEDEESKDLFAQKLAQRAVELLKDETLCERVGGECKLLCGRYTWENSVDTWLYEFGEKEIETKNLILMTAVLSGKRLDYIFNNIKETLMDKNIRVMWLLCYDKYNSKDDLTDIVNKCKEYSAENSNFLWGFYPTGKPNQKNYGGVMYNEPLKWAKENYFGNVDPWVLVLDDDNIICNLLSECIYNALDTAEKLGKPVIYTNILYENGMTAPFCRVTAWPENPSNHIAAYYTIPDPSQLFLKYSEVERMGFYQEGLRYDEKLWHYLSHNKDRICFPEDWSNDNRLNKFQTTHNGVPTKERLAEFKKALNIKGEKYCYAVVCSNKKGVTMYPFDVEIFKKMIDYYEHREG